MHSSFKEISLYRAFSLLKNEEEWNRFLTDLCTPQELKVIKERWRLCQLLQDSSLSYRAIHTLTKASLTTIGRVARFLKQESNNGYKLLLERNAQEEKP